MTRNITITSALALALISFPSMGYAQESHNVRLHVNPKWKECSFQLDPSLTQRAWRQFTREAGLVTYFRSLTDAKPLGRGNFEVSALQYETSIDDTDAAWNDTFVHPDSTHWLLEGPGLGFPGLTVRAGLTDKTDVGAYYTKAPGANYGFYGAQVQRNLVQNDNGWDASARVSFVSMYGPKDLDFRVFGADLVGSKEYTVSARWLSVSPYAGVSTYLSSSHEKSAVVDLADENVFGVQAMVGAVVQVWKASLAVEYNSARVNSRSMKVGFRL